MSQPRLESSGEPLHNASGLCDCGAERAQLEAGSKLSVRPFQAAAKGKPGTHTTKQPILPPKALLNERRLWTPARRLRLAGITGLGCITTERDPA